MFDYLLKDRPNDGRQGQASGLEVRCGRKSQSDPTPIARVDQQNDQAGLLASGANGVIFPNSYDQSSD
jgi:hypothetical protein